MYKVDPQIHQAATLAAQAYRDGNWYQQQLELIFACSWQFLPVQLSSEPELPLLPLTLLPESLNEPLLLSHDGEQWHCLSNVCTHRGAIVQAQPGKRRHLQCPYHGRCFDLRGRFVSMPAFEDAQNFPGPADDLPTLALKRLGPWAFTALSTPNLSFEAWIAPLKKRLAWVPWQDFYHDPVRDRDYTAQTHWMLYVENYLEGLHIPYIHPALNQALDFKHYQTHCLPNGVLQIGMAAPDEPCFELPAHHPDAGQRIAAYYFWLFPNFMLNLYPWGASLNLVEPQGLAQCRIRYQTWIWQPEYLDQGAGADVDQTEQEDQAIIHSVQRGIQSRLYHQGRYSPRMEQGLHHFHQLLTTQMRLSAGTKV